MEIWTLHHPDVGLITVQQGYDVEFRELHEDWPQEPPTRPDGSLKPAVRPSTGASPVERAKARIRNAPLRLQVLLDGEVIRRYARSGTGHIPLPPPTKPITKLAELERGRPPGGAHLRLEANAFGDLMQIRYHDGDQVVEFDAPPGTRAEKRQQAMAASSWKRTAYPILGGLSKATWALAVVVLGPAILAFLKRLMPDFKIPWPDLDLGFPAWPQIHLPVPAWPQIDWSFLNWPQIHLPVPDLTPMWDFLDWVFAYDKIWKPVLIGVFLGIVALHNHKKSQATKKEWDTKLPGAQEAPANGTPLSS